jgi:phosphoribosylanthranilate isomerase
MTFVKICGITNLDDALNAVQAGADALGFNFYRPSPRYIEPAAAAEIIEKLPKEILKVGVFVNEPTPGVVKAIATEAGVGAVQLHGDESPEYCLECSEFYVIKTFAVGPRFDPQSVRSYKTDGTMLDASHKDLRGGTGCRVDWDIAKEVGKITENLFLAGGLSPQNVQEAILKIRPYAVDVCSAIESAPGRKDHELVRKFVQAVSTTTR